MKSCFINLIILFIISLNLHAEDGHNLWLRGHSTGSVNVVCSKNSATLDIAKAGIETMLAGRIRHNACSNN